MVGGEDVVDLLGQAVGLAFLEVEEVVAAAAEFGQGGDVGHQHALVVSGGFEGLERGDQFADWHSSRHS